MDVLITYDIETHRTEGERRLARVAAVCERYGERIQYSVFQCRLSSSRFAQLVIELTDEIEPETDSVHIYRFTGSIDSSRLALGRPLMHDLGSPWIL